MQRRLSRAAIKVNINSLTVNYAWWQRTSGTVTRVARDPRTSIEVHTFEHLSGEADQTGSPSFPAIIYVRFRPQAAHAAGPETSTAQHVALPAPDAMDSSKERESNPRRATGGRGAGGINGGPLERACHGNLDDSEVLDEAFLKATDHTYAECGAVSWRSMKVAASLRMGQGAGAQLFPAAGRCRAGGAVLI